MDQHVAAGYEPVADAFESNFAEQREAGAACAVYVDGELVVDLWGGTADVDTGRPWVDDTTAIWNSSSKGAATSAFLRLVEQGLIDLNAPVSTYWPEFGDQGKQDITVTQVLNHSAGLAALDVSEDLDAPVLDLQAVYDWKPLVQAIERQGPNWAPGTRHGYHAQTFGFILDEITRRVTGKPIGQVFAEQVAAPLGLDLWLGLPEQFEDRVATMIGPDVDVPEGDHLVERLVEQLTDRASLLLRAVSNPKIAEEWDEVNTRRHHAAALTSANGIGTARSMAKMYAATIGEVDGARILGPEMVNLARTEQVRGEDSVCRGIESAWGLGYALNCELNPFGIATAHGHGGSGGSFGFADVENGVAFAYLMNRMTHTFFDVRPRRLIDAVYRSLGR